MRILRKIAIGLALTAMVPAAAQGPLPTEPAPAPAKTAVAAPTTMEKQPPVLDARDVEAWADGFMPYALERAQIPGAVVVVVKDGQPILEKGYGFADLKSRKPVDPQTTMFRPGSISKLFTWTAVMQQVEAGKLDLDTDVNRYLDFKIPPYRGKPITLRQIMTHTAGFEESIRYLISNDPKAAMKLGDYVKKALPERVFAPGSTPAYSNYATAVAGHIVERVSGIPFDDYIEQRIFAPLKMDHSTFRQPLPSRFKKDMSGGYLDMSQPAQPFEIVIPGPAGALSSSGADMAKFMIAHLNDGGPLLEPQTTKMMHDYRAPGTGPLNTMALGFYEQWINGQRAIAHGGDTGVFHSDLFLFPKEDVGIYISMNSAGQEGASQAVRSALFEKFANRYFPGDVDFTPIDAKIARQHAAMMAGDYVMSRGSFTNFMALIGLLGPTKVVATPDGSIAVPSLDGFSAGVRDWVEVEPFLWRDRTTGERLAAVVEDGRVKRFSVDTVSPFTVMEPAPTFTNPGLVIPALLAALAIVMLAALAWPVRALVRRNFKAPFALTRRSLLAYRLSRVFAWLSLLAVAGWVALIAMFAQDLGSVGGPLDWLIILLRILSPIAAFGLLATAGWHLWCSIRDHRRWTMILGGVLLVLAGLILCWIVLAYNLYGFGMVY